MCERKGGLLKHVKEIYALGTWHLFLGIFHSLYNNPSQHQTEPFGVDSSSSHSPSFLPFSYNHQQLILPRLDFNKEEVVEKIEMKGKFHGEKTMLPYPVERELDRESREREGRKGTPMLNRVRENKPRTGGIGVGGGEDWKIREKGLESILLPPLPGLRIQPGVWPRLLLPSIPATDPRATRSTCSSNGFSLNKIYIQHLLQGRIQFFLIFILFTQFLIHLFLFSSFTFTIYVYTYLQLTCFLFPAQCARSILPGE